MKLNVISSDTISLPDSYEAWLDELHHPTVIELKGANSDVWRIVSVLIHGNEPSGFFATYDFIQSKIKPTTNLAISIASVRAARHESIFKYRHMPGEYDLNRRFGLKEVHDRVTELAVLLLDYMRARNPECILDLHNTSGLGPAFGVSTIDNQLVRQLTSLFVDQLVITQLVVGSLMEQELNCPIVTIECGGAKSTHSHQLAKTGLNKFAKTQNLTAIELDNFSVYYHPVRVKAHEGISLDYATQQDEDVDITLIENIEEFNTQVAVKGTLLAWLDRPLTDCLSAVDEQGNDLIKKLFTVTNGDLRCATDLKIFMATKRADIALSDCLFYVVKNN